MDNITGALYTVNGKNIETKQHIHPKENIEVII